MLFSGFRLSSVMGLSLYDTSSNHNKNVFFILLSYSHFQHINTASLFKPWCSLACLFLCTFALSCHLFYFYHAGNVSVERCDISFLWNNLILIGCVESRISEDVLANDVIQKHLTMYLNIVCMMENIESAYKIWLLVDYCIKTLAFPMFPKQALISM